MHIDNEDRYNLFYCRNETNFYLDFSIKSEANSNKSECMNNNIDINCALNNKYDTESNIGKEIDNNNKYNILENKENYNILDNVKEFPYFENDEHLKNDKTFFENKNNEIIKENEMPNTFMSINGKEIKKFNNTIIEVMSELFEDD